MTWLGWIIYAFGVISTAAWVCDRQRTWWRQALAVLLWPLFSLLLVAIFIHLMVADEIRHRRAK